MSLKEIKQKAVLKTVLMSIVLGGCELYWIIVLPKAVLVPLLFVILFVHHYYEDFPTIFTRAKMRAYINEFQLTPEQLAAITGQSKYDFPVNGKGKVSVLNAAPERTKDLVQKLTQQFGEL